MKHFEMDIYPSEIEALDGDSEAMVGSSLKKTFRSAMFSTIRSSDRCVKDCRGCREVKRRDCGRQLRGRLPSVSKALTKC